MTVCGEPVFGGENFQGEQTNVSRNRGGPFQFTDQQGFCRGILPSPPPLKMVWSPLCFSQFSLEEISKACSVQLSDCILAPTYEVVSFFSLLS